MPELKGGIIESREWLLLKTLDSVRDHFRVAIGQIRILGENFGYTREILDAYSDEEGQNDD